jgi:hypothetical protein
LATWISSALEKVLIEKNITNGFCTTGIFPFNPRAVDYKMGPFEFYKEVPVTSVGEVLELEATYLGAPENLKTISGTFTTHS